MVPQSGWQVRCSTPILRKICGWKEKYGGTGNGEKRVKSDQEIGEKKADEGERL